MCRVELFPREAKRPPRQIGLFLGDDNQKYGENRDSNGGESRNNSVLGLNKTTGAFNDDGRAFEDGITFFSRLSTLLLPSLGYAGLVGRR